jgi:hypothetical protein
VLDGEIVARDDDAFKEQAHQPLSVGKVKGVDTVTESGREGRQVVGDARDASGVDLLCGQLVGAHAGGSHRSIETLASSLELFDAHGPSLIGVQQSVHLQLKLALSGFKPRKLFRHARRSLTARPPRLDFLLQYFRALHP